MSRWMRGICIGVAVLLVLLGIQQCRSYEQKKEMRENALLYFKEEDYSKSIRYLEDALALHSVLASRLNQDMNGYLAESYYQLGEYEKAQKIYDELLREDSGDPKYYELKGRCAVEAGDRAGAVKIYESGYDKTGDSRFLEDICAIYLDEKEYKKALKFTRKGIEAGGDTLQQFLFQEVVIYEKAEQYEAAYEAVNEYCIQFPEDEEAKKEQIFLSTRIMAK